LIHFAADEGFTFGERGDLLQTDPQLFDAGISQPLGGHVVQVRGMRSKSSASYPLALPTIIASWKKTS